MTSLCAEMDVNEYLQRIEYNGPTFVAWETLVNLQKAHQMAVPFENCDIFEGDRKILDLQVSHYSFLNTFHNFHFILI